MGAVFEVAVISREFIPLEVSIEYLQRFGTPFVLEKLECIQDWTWTGRHELKMDDIKSAVEMGQIVLCRGSLSKVHAGVFLERNEDMTYQTQLWFEESFYSLAGVQSPVGSREFFTELETTLETWLEMFPLYGMTLAVMGEEIVFQYSSDLDHMREHCRVDRWIQF